MSDWFDDGSYEYEEEKAAKNSRIKSGAIDQLNALESDLEYLTGDDNMFTNKMDSLKTKHKFSEEQSTVDKDATISTIKDKGAVDMAKVDTTANVSGFETTGYAEENRADLAGLLSTKGSIADEKKITADKASLIKRDEGIKGVEGDWYKALRMLESEMLGIKSSAEGATGEDISYNMPDWDEIFSDHSQG